MNRDAVVYRRFTTIPFIYHIRVNVIDNMRRIDKVLMCIRKTLSKIALFEKVNGGGNWTEKRRFTVIGIPMSAENQQDNGGGDLRKR